MAHDLDVAPHEPVGALLCVEHLTAVLRERRRWRCSQPDCNRRLFAGPDRSCAWCMLGRPVSTNVTTEMLPVKIIRGADYLAAKKLALQEAEEAELENMEEASDDDDD